MAHCSPRLYALEAGQLSVWLKRIGGMGEEWERKPKGFRVFYADLAVPHIQLSEVVVIQAAGPS